MPKRSDLRALKSLIDQAYLIASSDPIPKGGIASLRENLETAKELARVLLIRPTPEEAAAALGKRGGKKTAERGSEYFRDIAAQRKTKAGGRPKKYQDVLESGAKPSEVRSRSAFVIARRLQELGMDAKTFAGAIHCTEQYARDLLMGMKIPSDEKIGTIIKGLNLGNLQADQLRTMASEDRRQNDGRYKNTDL